jgi:hypothetical protein
MSFNGSNVRRQQIDNPAGQVISGVTYVVALFIVLYIVEMVYFASTSASSRFKTLMGYTASPSESTIVIRQNLLLFPDANPIGLSVNERTGIEFSYSFYLLVNPETMDGNDTLKHVFHKGYSNPWPLMAPGVFMKGNSNTMRVVMSTYANPYTYVDVKNIPVQKWVHIVLNSYNKGVDVFVNGNIANRLTFENTLPYQNFGDITIFANSHYNYSGNVVPAIGPGNTFAMDGVFSGFLSNLRYTRYALSPGEIATLMAAGPSKVMKQRLMDKPPYLSDDWWGKQK